MSFVVVVSTSAILFTPPNGAENAFAGQTIASATWNATFTDICNNGLAVLGESPPNTVKGNPGATAAVVTDMTVAQSQVMFKQGLLSFPLRGINFNPSVATDNSLAISVPTARYLLDKLVITNASQTLTTAVVGLYTAVGAGGIPLALSQSVNVSSSLTDTFGNMAALTFTASTSIVNTAFNDASLQFRIVTAEGAAATADVILYVRPM